MLRIIGIPVFDVSIALRYRYGIKAETVVYGTENEKEASADVVKNGTSYEITVESKKASKVALMNVGAPKQVNGASYTQNGENVIVEFHGDGKAEVVF